MGNYTQIFRQGWIFSNTQEAVDNAGDNEKFAEKKVKSGIEVRKDVELSIVVQYRYRRRRDPRARRPAVLADDQRLPRCHWRQRRLSSGTGLTVAETTGTLRAFTKALLDNVMGMLRQRRRRQRLSCLALQQVGLRDLHVRCERGRLPRQHRDGQGRTRSSARPTSTKAPFGEVNIKPNRVMAAPPPPRAASSCSTRQDRLGMAPPDPGRPEPRQDWR